MTRRKTADNSICVSGKTKRPTEKAVSVPVGLNTNKQTRFDDSSWPKNHQKLRCGEPFLIKEKKSRHDRGTGNDMNTRQKQEQKQGQQYQYQRKRRKHKQSEDDEIFLVSYQGDDPIKVGVFL